MILQLKASQTNATPMVAEALEKLKAAGGGELHFECSEYHFFNEGARKEFFAVSNNAAGEKQMAFPILEMENLLIDGHGARFIFHDVVFPFMISKSRNITLCNLQIDTGRSPLVEIFIHDATEEGFYMDLDREESPFYIEDGSLFFERESGVVSGKEKFFSLHESGRHNVQYLATGICGADLSNLAAPLMKCAVEEAPKGIYARYLPDSPSKCKFQGQWISTIVDGGRSVDVVCLDRSKGMKLRNITVARGIGMGIIGQLSTDIEIDGFSTDLDAHPNGHQTLTADALHFVNCDGGLEIKNCAISHIMDDALNVHGMYTAVTAWSERELCAAIMHQEQRFFNPYRKGDRLELVDPKTFEIIAEFIVDEAAFEGRCGDALRLQGQFTYGAARLQEGFWIENPDRMPNLHLHHNHFHHFPHCRISGAGELLVEENIFTDCRVGLLTLDLAKYWYESGRVRHLVFRRNLLKNCSRACIRIGIDGLEEGAPPKIHQKIEIIENRFEEIRQFAIKAGGVKELIIEDNSYDQENPPMKLY